MDFTASILLVLVFFVVFLLSYLLLLRRRKNYPPGPRPLPLIGNVFAFAALRKMDHRLWVSMCELHKTHGDAICMWAMGQPFVFLRGYDMIHEAFVKNADCLSNRPSWFKPLREATMEGKGVIWQSGHEWTVIRRFVLQTLRNIGIGKTSLEDKIMAEVDAATEYLAKNGDKPLDPRLLTSMMISNVIYGIAFAKRYKYNDEELHKLIHNLDTFFQGGNAFTPQRVGPAFFQKLVNKEAYEGNKRRDQVVRWIKEQIYEEISNHEASFDDENIRDFVDLYIQAKKKESDETIFNKGNMFRVIMDLFLAGFEPMSSTMNWCILYMQEYPEVQKRCQQVIHEECGDKVVTMDNRDSLPYIEAVLLEIQRLANVVPLSLPHTNEVETQVGGYDIPRRSLIVANLYSSNLDPAHWEEPAVFRPERFLENGKLKKNPALIPFSIGPRICLGESLAKMEMFLIFTNLLQRFTFSREDASVKHSFDCVADRITGMPIPYKVRVTKRS